MDEDTLRRLFNGAIPAAPEINDSGDALSRLIAVDAVASSSRNMFAKTYSLRLITALLVRISLVASIWVFLFDEEKWIGVVLFLCLTAMFGGVQPFATSTTRKT